METKLIAMILGVALVLATATVYTQSVYAIGIGTQSPPGLGIACSNPNGVGLHDHNCISGGPLGGGGGGLLVNPGLARACAHPNVAQHNNICNGVSPGEDAGRTGTG
jgi:hypothetical protein